MLLKSRAYELERMEEEPKGDWKRRRMRLAWVGEARNWKGRERTWRV